MPSALSGKPVPDVCPDGWNSAKIFPQSVVLKRREIYVFPIFFFKRLVSHFSSERLRT